MFSHEYGTRHLSPSGWNALLPPRHVSDRPPAARSFGSIVIGGGYVGLAAARRLAELEPDRSVLLIEAETIGEGPSGRNSGFIGFAPNAPLAWGPDTVDDAAQKHLRLTRAAIGILRSLVQDHRIDCLWDEAAPRYDAAATARGLKNLIARDRSTRRWGMEGHFVERDALPGLIGTSYYQRAYAPHDHVLVQPAALVRGLADSLPANVHLLERTRVETLSSDGRIEIGTNHGSFAADRVLIAANAWARKFGLLRDRVFALYTYGALTPELDDTELAKLGSLPQWGIIPAHSMGTTLRKFTGRRLLVRSGEGYEREHGDGYVRALLTKLFVRRFPAMRSHDFEHVWGGALGMTHNGALAFGRVQPNVFVAAGCNGSGIARGTINGHLLAEMACGGQSSLLSDRLSLAPPNWIPPEPLRSLGARGTIAYLQWEAGREI